MADELPAVEIEGVAWRLVLERCTPGSPSSGYATLSDLCAIVAALPDEQFKEIVHAPRIKDLFDIFGAESERWERNYNEAESRAKALAAELANSCPKYQRDVFEEKLNEYIDKTKEAEARAVKAEENYRFMVESAAGEKLDGYRELGQRAATAENRRDALASELAEAKREASAARRRALYDAAERLEDAMLSTAADVVRGMK